MGNRAVITFGTNDDSPCIYLHWNGGRASVEAFLTAARHLGIQGTTAETMDRLAELIARWMKVRVNQETVYRERYGRADTDNHDNGTYVIDGNLQVVERLFLHKPQIEEYDVQKTMTILAEIILGEWAHSLTAKGNGTSQH